MTPPEGCFRWLEKNECSGGYFHVGDILTQWGVPGAIYSDRHTIFFSPKTEKLTEEDESKGEKRLSRDTDCRRHLLGIEHIAARSPRPREESNDSGGRVSVVLWWRCG